MDCSFSVRGISQQEYWSGWPFPSPANRLYSNTKVQKKKKKIYIYIYDVIILTAIILRKLLKIWGAMKVIAMPGNPWGQKALNMSERLKGTDGRPSEIHAAKCFEMFKDDTNCV